MNLDQFCLSYEDLPTGKGQAHVLSIFHSLFISQVGRKEQRGKKQEKKKKEEPVPYLEIAYPHCLWATQAPTSPFWQGKILVLLFQCKASV